jgi:hypothetical protein
MKIVTKANMGCSVLAMAKGSNNVNFLFASFGLSS